MTTSASNSPESHPIQPYAEALVREHEENLVSGRKARLAELLESRSRSAAKETRAGIARQGSRPVEASDGASAQGATSSQS